MNKKEILDILDNAKDKKGSVPMRLVRQAFDKQPTVQPVAIDTNVGDTISRKGVFIPNITVEMFRNASLEGVEDLMASGEMEDISLPSVQSEQKWIPCSERLPEESADYLVSVRWHREDDIEISVYDYNAWHKEWNDGESCRQRVIAWMPLPEPWKEGT